MVKPNEGPEPMPTITPEMIKVTLKALESKGMVKYMEGGAYVPTDSGWKLLTEIKQVKDEIIAYGHPSITATDLKLIVITKNNEDKSRAVIAVKSNKSSNDLKKELKDALREARKVEIKIEVDGIEDKVTGYGSPAMKLNNPDEIMIRKDDFIDNRTIAILADKSANELKQELVEKLRDGNTKVKITLEVK